jgi:hypothetical protein
MATPICETEQPNKAQLGKPPMLPVPTPPDPSKPRPMPKRFARSGIFWQPQRDWLAHTGPAHPDSLRTPDYTGEGTMSGVWASGAPLLPRPCPRSGSLQRAR